MDRDDWYAVILIGSIIVISVILAGYAVGAWSWSDIVGIKVTHFYHGVKPVVPGG